MNKELEEKLYHKYPKLFIQKDLDIHYSLMAFGLEINDGWVKILDITCQKIMDYCKNNNKKIPEFSQIKEKFGTLRIYADFTDDAIDNIIEEAEKSSSEICEFCGEKGRLIKSRYWLSVKCDFCKD